MNLGKILKKAIVCTSMLGFMALNLFDCNVISAANNYTYPADKAPSGITNLKVPTVINKGDSCSINGTVYMNNMSSSWYVGVMVYSHIYSNSSVQTQYEHRYEYASDRSTLKPASQTSYNLGYLDPYIQFNRLPAGKYQYQIYTLVNGVYTTKYTCNFVVANSYGLYKASTMKNVALTDYTLPSTIYYGNIFSLKGNMNVLYEHFIKKYTGARNTVDNSSYPLSLKAFVYKSGSNSYTDMSTGYFTISGYQSGSPSFSNKKRIVAIPTSVDDGIAFDKLNKGNYVFKYEVAFRIADDVNYTYGGEELLSHTFNVK